MDHTETRLWDLEPQEAYDEAWWYEEPAPIQNGDLVTFTRGAAHREQYWIPNYSQDVPQGATGQVVGEVPAHGLLKVRLDNPAGLLDSVYCTPAFVERRDPLQQEAFPLPVVYARRDR